MFWKRPCVPTLAAAAMLLAGLSATRAGQPVPPDKAYLVVILPADAQLTIGSSATRQIGPERHFLSPPLQVGKKYAYELTATWTENGKPQKHQRLVPVSAGQRSIVNFLEPETLPRPRTEKKESPKKEPEKKDEEKKDEVKSRRFSFTYAGAVKDLKPGTRARVWLPRPQTTPEQLVVVVDYALPNGIAQGHVEKQYGNKMYYFEGKADKDGRIPFTVTYQVTRKEVRTDDGGSKGMEDKLVRFLQRDQKVPVGGKSLELLKDKKLPGDPMDLARMLYDVVNRHLEYRKDKPGWGNGDADWACASKFGNCTDFHSMFIALARSQKIPAKFEIGFSLPEKHGQGEIPGYHCWAWFHVDGKGWVPVDISEANLHPKKADYYFGNLSDNRVQFTTGRDLTLNPPQAGTALNFFIYPYVEMNGRPYTAVERRFSFADVP